jgi:hypothetical protein
MTAVVRALAVVLVAAVFLRAGSVPVGILDSWGDWKYGQWIWEHRQLPAHEPFSSGGPAVAAREGGWLAEVAYYLVVARGGLEGVALLHALLEAAKAGLFLLAVRRSTGSLMTAVAATALMEAACWPFCDAIRTGTAAEVCWAALLLACSGRVPSRWAVAAAPLVVGLWANVSPTFGFAFVLLGGLLLGRFLEETRARRRLTAAAREPGVARLALMLALSVAAACCNPYGPAHLRDAFGTAGLTVLPEALLWPQLIPVDRWDSRAVIASVVAVLFVLRLSPRRLTPAEVLLTAIFAVWAWLDRRAALWWLMLAPWLLAPHLQAMAEALAARLAPVKPPRRVAWLTYPLAGVAAALVLVSPVARSAVGCPISEEQRTDPREPYRLAARLAERKSAAPRRVFAWPYWWGDYLLWRLPAGDRVFWYSRPEALMALQGQTVPGPDSSADDWRNLIDRHPLDVLVVQANAAAELSAYVDRLPRETPARCAAAMLAARTPWEAAAVAQAVSARPTGWEVVESTDAVGGGLLVVRRP